MSYSVSPPYGNFSQVSMGAALVFYNSVLCGYVKEVQVDYEETLEDLRVDVPGRLVGSIVKLAGLKAKAKLFQVSAENVAMVCGGLTVVPNLGSPVTITAEAYASVATFLGSPIYGCMLDGANTASVVVTLADGTTSLTANTDYWVVSASQAKTLVDVIYFSPASSHISAMISGGIKASYTYTPIASKQVNFGASFPISQQSIDIVHSIPGTTGGSGVNGRKIKLWHADLMRPIGKFSHMMNDQGFAFIDAEWESIYNDDNATAPLGYFLTEETT